MKLRIQMMRKSMLVACFFCCIASSLMAQKAPKWMKKAKNAVVSITTYGSNDQVLAKGNGFFVSETGEVLSAWSLFKHATRATVSDIKGESMPVDRIIGADELYDVIRFSVKTEKETAYLPLASSVAMNDKAYLLHPETNKEHPFYQGTITEITPLKQGYKYYKFDIPLHGTEANMPILSESGAVIGLAQTDASGAKNTSFAVSAAYAKSLSITSADVFSSTYTSIAIKKAWSSDMEQAQVMLFLLANKQNEQTYFDTLNDFIQTFPTSAVGYNGRAVHYANKAANTTDAAEKATFLEKATADIDLSIEHAPKKSEAFFDKAKLIYDYAQIDTACKNARWRMDAAQTAIEEALSLEPLPVYYQTAGNIFFLQKKYTEAYDAYMKVCESDLATAEMFYLAAKSKEQMRGTNIADIITLLDRAVGTYGQVLTSAATPYLMERYQWKVRLQQFDAALVDLATVFRLNPTDIQYPLEEASLLIRIKRYDDAILCADKALELDPNDAASFRLKGFAYIQLKKQKEACAALKRAVELGDDIAAKLQKKHCK